MKINIWQLVVLVFTVGLTSNGAEFSISLQDAEQSALRTSHLLKSYGAEEQAAQHQADAQFQGLLPKLSLSGGYSYYNAIPQIGLPGFAPFAFGTNNVYSVGPVLSYTLFDGSSTHDAYRALSLLTKAKQADRESAQLQLLLSLRSTYVQVQLGLEELGLIQDSLELARAQSRDVSLRFKAGAATRLDLLTARRTALSYEIQFKQKQAELSASLKDLFNLLGDHEARDLSHPGPPDVPNVELVLKLQSLEQLLAQEGQSDFAAPGDSQPQIRSQALQSESFDLNASSQSAKAYPTIQLSAGVNLNRPDIPNPPDYWQETVGVSLSLPLWLGDSSRDLAAQQRAQADAAKYREKQLKDDLSRDFGKAREMLSSLREQRVLSLQDVEQSEEESKLYYISYKAGKINFIDVQNANNQALQAKVSSARIAAQILNQLIILKSLAGGTSS